MIDQQPCSCIIEHVFRECLNNKIEQRCYKNHELGWRIKSWFACSNIRQQPLSIRPNCVQYVETWLNNTVILPIMLTVLLQSCWVNNPVIAYVIFHICVYLCTWRLTTYLYMCNFLTWSTRTSVVLSPWCDRLGSACSRNNLKRTQKVCFETLLFHRYHCDQSTSFWPLKKILFQYTKNTMFFRVKISKLKINFQFRLSWLMFIKLTEWCTWMLGNMKLISRVVQDIWLVRFVHSWDILSNTWNKFHISAQPRIILFIFQSFGKFIRALELLS